MEIGVRRARTAEFAATLAGVVLAPVLIVAGGPLLYRFIRWMNREDGPGFIAKERGWVHPTYFFVHNGLVRFLTWPSEKAWEAYQERRGWPERSP